MQSSLEIKNQRVKKRYCEKITENFKIDEIFDHCFCTSLYLNKRLFISKQLRANLTEDGCKKKYRMCSRCYEKIIKYASTFFFY